MSDLKNKLIKLAHDNPELRPHLLPLLKTAGDSAVMIRNADQVMDSLLRKFDTFKRRALSTPEILKATNPGKELEQVNNALHLLANKLAEANAYYSRDSDLSNEEAILQDVLRARSIALKQFERIRKNVLVRSLPPGASDVVKQLMRVENVLNEVTGYINQRNLL